MTTNLYRVSFDVDGDCSWDIDATSPDAAREAGITRFRSDRFWAQRYPVTPPCTVELLTEGSGSPGGGSHGDVGPFF